MPLTILSDNDVKSLLHSLTRADILKLQQSLADALHYYSTSTADDAEGGGCCSTYQPPRTHLKRRDGGTTLFMPASSNEGMGVKTVTLSGGGGNTAPSSEASSVADASTSLSSLSIKSATESTKSSLHDSNASKPTTAARGALTLLDASGSPRALINAQELTAFRTALASTMLFNKRANVHDVTVFGAGKQAYWHIRLALLLRGEEVHHVNVVNRSFERARELIMSLFKPDECDEDEEEGGRGGRGREPLHRPKIALLTPLHTDYSLHLKNHVRSSSALFLCTPSRSPLFPHNYLTSTSGRTKGRYVAAIGSYTPEMIELPVEVLWQAVKGEKGQVSHHRHAREGGAVVVDSVEGAVREAGEIVQAGVGGEGLVELGELVMLGREARGRREREEEKRSRSKSKTTRRLSRSKSRGRKSFDGEGVEVKDGGGDGGLRDWLERGNVIYKSVGLGLMDVVVGNNLVELADQRGVGTRILDF
ncbi:NAD(P)-binding protein [Saccharata proteae CBS 121410]|uniref:NAD(P)-binding protein n=1 Tax=Saccharata proteae CBS 121410 TaxID=1314787 RepID=A0A6A5YDC7_9PEZI|nr:NAD(P)-binding protein [Saccharata proteae CBS 121410]